MAQVHPHQQTSLHHPHGASSNLFDLELTVNQPDILRPGQLEPSQKLVSPSTVAFQIMYFFSGVFVFLGAIAGFVGRLSYTTLNRNGSFIQSDSSYNSLTVWMGASSSSSPSSSPSSTNFYKQYSYTDIGLSACASPQTALQTCLGLILALYGLSFISLLFRHTFIPSKRSPSRFSYFCIFECILYVCMCICFAVCVSMYPSCANAIQVYTGAGAQLNYLVFYYLATCAAISLLTAAQALYSAKIPSFYNAHSMWLDNWAWTEQTASDNQEDGDIQQQENNDRNHAHEAEPGVAAAHIASAGGTADNQ